jgi:AraC-like DNA-binding protein
MAETSKLFLQENLRRDLQAYLQSLRRMGAGGAARIVLAEPPHFSPAAEARRVEKVSLAASGWRASGIMLAHWPQQRLNSIRHPLLGLALEGEAEVPVATPPGGSTPDHAPGVATQKKKNRRKNNADIFALRLSAPDCLLIPAGVPHHDGTRPFWKFVPPPQRLARVLWIHLLPTGAICHSDTMRGQSQQTSPYLFLPDAHLSLVAELLLEELREREADFGRAATGYLTALLTRIERALQSPQSSLLSPAEGRFPVLPAADSALSSAIVGRAVHFIQTHLHEPLSPPAIARHVHVSPAHLNRLFRAETGLPVMEYVTQCRRDNAASLLQNTDLTIAQVGQLVGYANPSHFAHAFTRWTGTSPRAFRRSTPTGKSGA